LTEEPVELVDQILPFAIHVSGGPFPAVEDVNLAARAPVCFIQLQ
jgi:hypothetical protein